MRYRLTAARPVNVYPPREDSELLLPVARDSARRSVLEVGCGAGLASIAAARAGARVVATDLNPAALRFVRAAALREALPIDVVRTDLARGLRRFDRVLANPPYLPTRPSDRDADRWQNLALDGGPDGWATTARLLRALPNHLSPEGDAYLVVSSRQHARRRRSLLRWWRSVGGGRRVLRQRRLGRERLSVWRLWLTDSGGPERATTGSPRRAPPRRRGTAPRRSGRPASRSASSPAPGTGRSAARGGASGRRRSPRGS